MKKFFIILGSIFFALIIFGAFSIAFVEAMPFAAQGYAAAGQPTAGR